MAGLYRNLLESSDPDRRTWNRIRNDSYICQSTRRIWSDIYAWPGNIPGKTGTISQKIAMVIQDGDYMTAGVWVAIVMVIAFLVIFMIESDLGQENEECQEVVRDGDRSKDSEKTEYI